MAAVSKSIHARTLGRSVLLAECHIHANNKRMIGNIFISPDRPVLVETQYRELDLKLAKRDGRKANDGRAFPSSTSFRTGSVFEGVMLLQLNTDPALMASSKS